MHNRVEVGQFIGMLLRVLCPLCLCMYGVLLLMRGVACVACVGVIDVDGYVSCAYES